MVFSGINFDEIEHEGGIKPKKSSMAVRKT